MTDDSNVRTYADSLDDPPNSRLFLVTSKSTTEEVFIAQSRSSGSHRDVEDEELTRIFIMIPKTFTEEDLKEKFKEYGDIEYCIVIRNKTTGESKGLGYVRYLKPSQAAMAIENCDRNYRAILAEPKNRTSASCESDYFSTPRSDHMSHDPGMNSYPFAEASNFGVSEMRGSDSITKCLLVSSRVSLSQEQMFNLFDLIPGLDHCEMQRDPYGYNKDVLEDVFWRKGSLIEVYIVQGRNVGYIKFADRKNANEAMITLHGKVINGVKLKVMLADPPKEESHKRQRIY
ncbi:UNVERIFIED_CONTAM: hypothetical protein FKN15_055471 [Acipenser sinensis]